MSAEPTTWHAQPATLGRYARGELAPAAAASVEAHLLACAAVSSRCRRCGAGPTAGRHLGCGRRGGRRASDDSDRARSWRGSACVTTRHDCSPRRPSLTARLAALRRGGPGLRASPRRSPTRAACCSSSCWPPSCRSWGSRRPTGATGDPTYDVALAAPYPSLRLLLLRASAVLATTVTLVGLAALLLPAAPGSPPRWLLPALALTVATLTLSARIPAAAAVGAVVAVWLGAVFTTDRATGSAYAAFGAAGQAAYLALLVISIV